GAVDAAATIDLNWEAWKKDGTIDENQVVILDETDLYDHCIFVAHPDFSPDAFAKWQEVLCRMDYNNEDHQKMMDMEGLKEWVGPRTTGFKQLEEANDYLNFFNSFVK